MAAPSAQIVERLPTENGNSPQDTAAIAINGTESIARNLAKAKPSQKDPL